MQVGMSGHFLEGERMQFEFMLLARHGLIDAACQFQGGGTRDHELHFRIIVHEDFDHQADAGYVLGFVQDHSGGVTDGDLKGLIGRILEERAMRGHLPVEPFYPGGSGVEYLLH